MPRHLTRKLRIACAALAASVSAPALGQGLGIDLGATKKKDEQKQPEKAKPAAPPAPAKPAAPLQLPGIEVTGKGGGKQRLEAAKRLFQDKNYEGAAVAFHDMLRDPRLAEDHDEARYQLAKSLVRLKLYYSALSRFEEILAKGQGSKYFHTALEWLFFIGKNTANEQVILSQVARFANESFPPAYQDKFHYLLAKYNFERGRALIEAGQVSDGRRSYEEAHRLAAMVRPAGNAPLPAAGEAEAGVADDGEVYARARFLDGLVLYAQGSQQNALESFKDVVRLTNPRRAQKSDVKLRELAFLQLARIHYEHKQNRYAIFYYGKMPWGEERWLEGLWESSYAYYRIGDYEKSLGNLLTLHSPYFRDEYFPESYVLKAIIYFENCRYPEARAILEDFGVIYEPVHQELVRLTSRIGPASSYFDLIESTEKAKDQGERPLMRRILKLAFTDKNIKQLNDSILEIEDEMDVGLVGRGQAFRASALAKELGEALRGQRGRLVDEAGARARQKLEYERDALRELLEQALRVKIEVSRKEREALEGALAKGGRIDVVKPYRYSVAVSDEHLYWPYEAEFWRDELGTYSYTLTKGCREQLTARPQAASRQ